MPTEILDEEEVMLVPEDKAMGDPVELVDSSAVDHLHVHKTKMMTTSNTCLALCSIVVLGIIQRPRFLFSSLLSNAVSTMSRNQK